MQVEWKYQTGAWGTSYYHVGTLNNAKLLRNSGLILAVLAHNDIWNWGPKFSSTNTYVNSDKKECMLVYSTGTLSDKFDKEDRI